MNETRSAPAGAFIRDSFVGWQCRVRQLAMRNDQGCPSDGMTPRVLGEADEVVLDRMVTLIVPRQPHESTAFFRHQVRRSNDRREILEKGLTYLQATHFQQSTGFRDELTAVFGPASEVARNLLEMSSCILEFAQFNQMFRLLCTVRALGEDSDMYQATLWHNRLFNPELPDGVTILGFHPDWVTAQMTMPD
ncbi:MAG: hypothetical protein ACR2O4_17990 [Hyphomicrobiaceae bacterium]